MALFDLDNDIGETMNVADKHPDVVKKLRGLYDAWRGETADPRSEKQPLREK